MKILMVSLVNFHKSEGNAAHQLGLFQAWIRQGHDVRLIAPRRNGGGNPELPHGERIHFSPSVISLGLPPIADALPQILTVARRRFGAGYRVLYLRANSLSFMIALAARLMGMRVVAEHNSWMASERAMNGGGALVTTLEELCQVWLARLSHNSRCVSPGIRDLLIAKGLPPERLFVVGNGTDTRNFFPLEREEALRRLDLDPARIWIGFLGSMNPWQGIATAIRALHLLRADSRLHMILAGDGPEQDALRALVAELDLAGRVVFFDRVNFAEANVIVNCFDIALAPFTWERNAEIGLSAIKIRDYAAAGRVVAASELDGIRELAGEDWLHVHEPDNPQELAKLLSALADRIGDSAASKTAARRYAEEQFSWPLIAEAIAGKLTPRAGR